MKTVISKLSVLTLAVLMLLSLFCFAASAEDGTAAEAVTSAETEAATEIIYATQCPECAALTNGTPYCPSCGEEMPEVTAVWTCQHVCKKSCKHVGKHEDATPCGAVNEGEYCVSCGSQRPEDESGMVFNFMPDQFVANLKYMAAGMVGIFLVIGVIILTIVFLGKVTAPKKSANDAE